MEPDHAPNGPFRLVTINTAPARARLLVGRTIEKLKDQYRIVHVANCEAIEEVEATVTNEQPDVVFCASMWTNEEASKIRAIVEGVRRGTAFYAIPHGLQVEKGPDAVVDHLVEVVPKILDHVSSSS